MTARRAAALAVLCLAAAAPPAAASKRSEAHAIIAALQPKLTLTDEQREALVADREARAAGVAASCMDAVKAATADEEHARAVFGLYLAYVDAGSQPYRQAWQSASQGRLAALELHTGVLRRGRAARTHLLALQRRFEVTPPDFCAALVAWQAAGSKGQPGISRDQLDDLPDGLERTMHRMLRAKRVLRRHGLKGRGVMAWYLEPTYPALRKAAPDPVYDLIVAAAFPGLIP